MALLELKNVVASYGNINALKGISLSVPEGKIVTLIGANGAGKSTTMRTIMGLMKPKEGDVLFNRGNVSKRNCFPWYGTGTGRPSDSSEYDRSGKSADGSLSAPGQGRNGQGHESYI